MNKLMELVDLHADAVCNVLEGAEDATSGKSWLTIRDVFYAEIQAIADSMEWDNRLLWGVMHNLKATNKVKTRWAVVVNTFGCGSTKATELCRRFNLDPDEELPDIEDL